VGDACSGARTNALFLTWRWIRPEIILTVSVIGDRTALDAIKVALIGAGGRADGRPEGAIKPSVLNRGLERAKVTRMSVGCGGGVDGLEPTANEVGETKEGPAAANLGDDLGGEGLNLHIGQ
jgi:hypothetical protein